MVAQAGRPIFFKIVLSGNSYLDIALDRLREVR
jgi:hypothetical protein